MIELSALESLKDFIPVAVIVAVIANIMLVYFSSFLAKIVEEYYETEMGKQIRFFDHKKIWLSLFWCVITSLTLALADFIQWREMPFYMFVILGASTFLYEAFLKKFGVKKND